MSRSTTSTDDWLPDLYPGADLREDLFQANDVTVAQAAEATGLQTAAIDGFLDGTSRIDVNFDLRLGRFFGFSPEYLLRLQNSYDLLEAKRHHGADIARIQPRLDRAA